MDNYEYKHVQSAAAYIADAHHHLKHHPILAHPHLQSQPTGKYVRIMNSDRDALVKKMKYDPQLRDALSNSVHAAHEGGHIDFRPKHMHSLGGGFSFSDVTDFVQKVADLVKEMEHAKEDFDAVGPLDKAFSSPRHFAKAALHGYAGNWRAHSAYAKATAAGLAIVPGTQVAAAGMVPAAVGMDEIAEGLDALNDEI